MGTIECQHESDRLTSRRGRQWPSEVHPEVPASQRTHARSGAVPVERRRLGAEGRRPADPDLRALRLVVPRVGRRVGVRLGSRTGLVRRSVRAVGVVLRVGRRGVVRLGSRTGLVRRSVRVRVVVRLGSRTGHRRSGRVRVVVLRVGRRGVVRLGSRTGHRRSVRVVGVVLLVGRPVVVLLGSRTGLVRRSVRVRVADRRGRPTEVDPRPTRGLGAGSAARRREGHQVPPRGGRAVEPVKGHATIVGAPIAPRFRAGPRFRTMSPVENSIAPCVPNCRA